MHRVAIMICVVLVAPVAAAAPDAEPGEDTRDMPPEIVQAVRERHIAFTAAYQTELDRKVEHERARDERNKRYQELRERFAKFDARWKEFQARKQIVDQAVADADARAKAGKLDEARTVLEAVITPIARDEQGKPIRQQGRALVEVRDAELLAVIALAGVERDQHDWNAMIATRALMRTLHRIEGDEAAMRVLAVAWVDQSSFIGYNQSDTSRWSNGRVAAARAAADGGTNAAVTFDDGLRSALIGTQNGKLAKGDWVAMPYLSGLAIKGEHVSYAAVLQWRVPTSCQPSSRISYIDGNGVIHYEDDCTYVQHSEKVSLDATLREPVPDWVSHAVSITLIGKLVAAGPHWKLTDAVVADTRTSD